MSVLSAGGHRSLPSVPGWVTPLLHWTAVPRITTSSLTTKLEAVTHTKQWLASQSVARIAYALRPCKRWGSGMGHPGWHTAMLSSAAKTTVDLLPWPCQSRETGNWSQTGDLKFGIPVASLPLSWCCRISGGTGWPSVNTLGLGETASLFGNCFLSVAVHLTVQTDPSRTCV